ncbi:MAG: hypothetical protein KGL39_06140 [Patescibacteria group bacterium]|nr:hypothetical protein [Patescibacteria group bacterium]
MENGGKEDIRSWCHDWPPSFAKSTQEARLVGTIYYGDLKRWELPALIRSIRAGGKRVVEVVELFLLAPRKGRADVRRRALERTVEEILERGAMIRELNTGHESKRQLPRMMTRAVEMIGRSGRGKRSAINGSKSKGRPKKFTREQKVAARQIWFSREYATAEQAVAAMQAIGIKAKRTHCYNQFGPRNPQVEARD